MRLYWNINHKFKELPAREPGCWVEVVHPDEDDRRLLLEHFRVPRDFLEDILDKDERSRYDADSGWTLIILRIPTVNTQDSRTSHCTVPFGILTKGQEIITVCNHHTEMMDEFIRYQQRRGEGFIDSVDLVFRLFLSSSEWYLAYLKQINQVIQQAKAKLDTKVDNSDLINLSRTQDSLTYFITSIRGNETLLSKLRFKLPIDELDADLMEDVNIEMNQARETTSIYMDIISTTIDTYANVINNNMNSTMKLLTSISVILMFPTLVASIFGMNVVNGLETGWWGMPLVLLLTVVVTLIFYKIFRRQTWL